MKNSVQTCFACRIGWTLTVLLACMAIFQILPLDLWIQDLLYDAGNGRWIWNRDEPVSRLLLYDGAKAALTMFWVGIGVSLMLARSVARLRPYRRGLRIVFVSLVLVPLSVAALKASTNIACPRDLVRYGGDVEHVGVLPLYPQGSEPAHRQMCFPASHASGGFALFSLFFLFRSKVNRRRALYCGFCIGGIAGAYKMAIGDHFLSHTVVSMVLAWLIVNLVAQAEARLYGHVRAHDQENVQLMRESPPQWSASTGWLPTLRQVRSVIRPPSQDRRESEDRKPLPP